MEKERRNQSNPSLGSPLIVTGVQLHALNKIQAQTHFIAMAMLIASAQNLSLFFEQAFSALYLLPIFNLLIYMDIF